MISRIRLSPEGPEVSRFAYGTWRLLKDPDGASEARIRTKIEACLDLGVTTFDLAAVYGGYQCEAAFGAALAAGSGLRARMEIVTKCGISTPRGGQPEIRIVHYDLRSRAIVASAEGSLAKLRTDHIDLFLLHRPSPFMDPDEIAAALTDLRRAGKIRFAGVSNFSPSQFDLVQSRLDFSLVTNQIEVSVLHTEPMFDGTLDHLTQRRLRPMAWSPTSGGRLFTSEAERAVELRRELGEIALRHDATLEQVAYAWLLAHPSRMQVILGTNRIERVRDALASERIQLSLEEWFAVLRAARGMDVP